jgi:hypothetical protein
LGNALWRSVSLAAALCAAAGSLTVAAQEQVVNGNFTANAAQFTTWPGYVGSGANPANITGWTEVVDLSGGIGVNGAGTVTSVFGPANSGGLTFAFIQSADTKGLAQNLPGLAPNTSYTLAFQAAGRSQPGESNDTFRVQLGESAIVFTDTGALAANNSAFQSYGLSFTTPAAFYGTPSITLYNLSPGGDHTVDFANVSVQAMPAALAVFLPAIGDWNAPGNWSQGTVPGLNLSPDILNGSVVTVDSSVPPCSSVFVGQGSQAPTGTVLFRPGAMLAAADVFLGRDGRNYGQFNQSGGTLLVNGCVSVGDSAGGGSGASGEYNLSGGTLTVGETVLVGNQGLGQMLVAGDSVLSAPSIQVGVAAGAAGSHLFQWGGTICASNVTIGAAGVSNCAFTISSGVTTWTGTLLVSGQLTAQGSQFLLQDSGGGVGMQLADGATLRLEMDALGFLPIRLGSARLAIAAGSELVVDGSRYTRWLAAPGRFPLILHGGYAGLPQFTATNVTLEGFGNLTAALSCQSNEVDLVLAAPTNGVAPLGQGLLCEYWQVPITVNPGVPGRVIAAPLSALPDFTNSLVAEHPIYGRVITNFDLSGRLQDTNYFMRFSGCLSVPASGEYTFYLNSDDGSKLWLDGNLLVNNDGVHAPLEVSAVTNLTAGMHGLIVGYFQAAGGQTLAVSWAGPGFGKQPIPNTALFLSPQTARSVRQPVYQDIVQDSEALYNYAPSFMYDEVEGLYKIWMCGNGIPGCVGGDNILYREATSLAGLMAAPLTVAFQPSQDPTKFDQVDACDPDVYRVGNVMYMAYGGNTDGSQLVATTRLGMAVSYDGGRTFQRLNNGDAILSPVPADASVYGIGQPAVAQAPDGYYYMIYTDVSATNSLLRVIRSLDPGFSPGSFTNVATLTANQVGGFSLDLGFDDHLSCFVVIVDMTVGPTLEYYSTNWQYVRSLTLTNPFAWSFGEGIGLLMNSGKRPVNHDQDGVCSYVTSASVVDSTNDTTLWANWVAGDLKYLVSPLNGAPAITPLAGTNVTAGATLNVAVSATDPNVPALPLTYSLLQAPAGMTVNSASGLISWQPGLGQSLSTNTVVVQVSDNGFPPLLATRSFVVTVTTPPPPRIFSPRFSGNTFSVQVSGAAGLNYIVQSATNLTAPINWKSVTTNALATPPFAFTDSDAAGSAQRFYRVLLGP